MLAVFITKPGGPDVVKVKKTPLPEFKDGQALVKVYAAGINYADVAARSGLYPDVPKFPFIPGYEFAGLIEKARNTNSVKQGDRVLGVCLFSAQAEYVAVDEKQLFPIPEKMSFEQAAAMPVNFLTAYYALFRLGNLGENEKVLIHSCAGGVGTAAVQLAQTKNAVIFGTTSTEEKIEYLKKTGVHYPINYRKEDFREAAKQILGNSGINLILDPVGGPTFKKSYRLLAPGGRIICYGVIDLAAGGRRNIIRLLWKFLAMPRISTLNLIQNNKGVFGLALNRLFKRADEIRLAMNDLLRLFNKGLIKPEINRVFKLNEVSLAHASLESGKSWGKFILKIRD
jgi:NADPH:quinone reductase-like Zn-dependent oxidoreductase